jgi:DNA-directed RNA polymerase subunit N (RpoN/RPB10)
MLYPICPTCGTLLANIQVPYQEDLKKLCDDFNISHEAISQGTLIKNVEFANKKEALVNKYVDRMCCKMRLISFSDLVHIVK